MNLTREQLEAKRAEIMARERLEAQAERAQRAERSELEAADRAIDEEEAAARRARRRAELERRNPGCLERLRVARAEVLARGRTLATEGRRKAAREGRFTSGPVPFGYRRVSPRGALAIDPVEGEVVRLIFQRYNAGRSLLKIVRELVAAERCPGRRWSRAGVAWILRSEMYRGFVVYGTVRAKGQHPALVSAIEWHKAGARLRANDKRLATRRALAEGVGVDFEGAKHAG